jgi:hypothetical protein
VPQLAKSDGLASVSGMMVGAESFRGKMLRYCEEILQGTDLGDRAYSDHEADALVSYGEELASAADDYEDRTCDEQEQAVEDKVYDLRGDWEEEQSLEYDDCDDWPEEPDFEEQAKRKLQDEGGWPEITGDYREQLDTVRSAARWCIFWGKNGHGMHAWY